MTQRKLSNTSLLSTHPRIIFQTNSGATAKGYLKRKHTKLSPLEDKHVTMTNKKCKTSVHYSDTVGSNVNLPPKMEKPSGHALVDQNTLIKEYKKITESQEELPDINIRVHTKRNRTETKATIVKKTPRSRKLRETEWKKGRPMFTEGLSSKSVQEEPIFYLRNQLVINSNQPGGVHYVRDKSKLILEATVDSHRSKSKVNHPKYRHTVSSLSMPKLVEAPTWGKLTEGVQVTRNNTMLLPKVFINQELPLIDSMNQGRLSHSLMYTPRNVLSTEPLPVNVDVVEDAPSVTAMAKIKNSEYPEDTVAPMNSPIKGSRRFGEPSQAQDNFSQDSQGKIGPYDNNDARSHLSSQRGSRRFPEAPSVVSIGNSEDMEFTRRYKPTGKSSVASTWDLNDTETRPSTMESRMALSTPGRKLRMKKPAHDSMSLGVIESRAGTQTKVVISEDENMVYNFVYNSDTKAEAKIPKIMFGDPVKDSKKQDKKLNNSKLSDLYQRGIIQSQTACSPIPRLKNKEDIRNIIAGNISSRASGQSTIALGNPPPSLATATSSPPYDLGKHIKMGVDVLHELNDQQLETDMSALCVTDGEVSLQLEEEAGEENNNVM